MRRLVLSVVLALVVAPNAAAGVDTVVRAAEALREDSVYVDPQGADLLSPGEADRLRDQIAQAGGGIYVAILPSVAGRAAETVLLDVARRTGRRGTYAVVAGRSFRAVSNGAEQRTVPGLASEALTEHRDDGVAAVLTAFVEAIGAERRGESPAADKTGGGGDDGDSGLVLLGVLGAAAAGGVAFAVRRRRRAADDLRRVKEAAEEDLVALADDVRTLELDVEMPGADPRAKAAYTRAVEAYERASSAFRSVRAPADVEIVTTAVDEGRYAMAAARALLEGREPPARRPLCFFDPRHGLSVADVEWQPSFGEPRPVPACGACALRLERGEEPHAREVLAGGRRTQWWNAGPAYGGWAGGFYGGAAGGLLPMLLVGSMLGAGLGYGAGPAYGAGDGGFGGNAGAGDSGGGDFGDVGGGDFGGGDFGGGDF